ncbi:MAG TPA: c-type cytochrome [Kofleriaceae bacterium]|nr:c-type cytochrome [Kofleriaceae bacterium]
MPTSRVLAVLLLTLCACKKDNAKPGKTPTDAAAVAVARPADAAPTRELPPAADGGAAPAGGTDAGAKAPPPGEGDEKPTNLEVLPKTMTTKQVATEMKKISKDLGVKCDFCHVENDFPSDDVDKKGEARKMLVMTRDLNKQFFKGKNEVTCFTCHQGQKEPKPD